MRKEESQFVTKCISEAGSFSKNRDFTGFINLDNYSCWVVVDGIDSSDEKMSAEIAASSIIEDFNSKPGFSKKLLKKYVYNAHNVLNDFTGKSKLAASIMVIISDYNKIMYAFAGNTRFYHLRKDKIIRKTKDHSIAKLMTDLGEISGEEVNGSKHRNTLYNHLGKDGKLKIEISEKIRILNDDVFLLGTTGMWEKMDEKDLGDILKGSMDAEEFAENIEYVIKEKDSGNLNNYSIMSIFAEKIFDYKEAKKKTANEKPAKKINLGFLKNKFFKKVMLFLLIALLGTGALLIRNHINQVNQKKQEEQAVKSAGQESEKEAAKLLNGGNFADSLSTLEDAKEKYKDDPAKLKEIEDKIKKIKTVMSAVDLEKAGDKNIESKNYEGALTQYTNALNILTTEKTGNTTALEDKISNTKEIIKILSLEKSGDDTLAKQDFNGAVKIYENLIASVPPEKFPEITERVKGKIESLDQIDNAMSYEKSGLDFYKKGKYDQALNRYNAALVIYQSSGMAQKQKEVKNNIDEIEELQGYEATLKEGKALEEAGDNEIEKKNYDKAKSKYEEAIEKYDAAESQKNVVKASDKIENIEILKKYDNAKAIETEGDRQFGDKKYKKSIEKYEEAKEIYNDLNKSEEYGVVEDKIAKAKKKDKILGIF